MLYLVKASAYGISNTVRFHNLNQKYVIQRNADATPIGWSLPRYLKSNKKLSSIILVRQGEGDYGGQ
ncbi:MAG: hypothetical protein ABI045_01975 [Flavobacteriales bacterium]